MAQKTYLFKELYIETIIRNPEKVGLSGYRSGLECKALRSWESWVRGFRFLGFRIGLGFRV